MFKIWVFNISFCMMHEFHYWRNCGCKDENSWCSCVCGPGKPYIMGTKRPHKDVSIWNIFPCGEINWKTAYKSYYV